MFTQTPLAAVALLVAPTARTPSKANYPVPTSGLEHTRSSAAISSSDINSRKHKLHASGLV